MLKHRPCSSIWFKVRSRTVPPTRGAFWPLADIQRSILPHVVYSSLGPFKPYDRSAYFMGL